MIYCYAIKGFEGQLVRLEVELRRSLPGMDLVGLPDGAVKEAKERVRAAIRAADFDFPRERILVNLAPAGIPKSGTAYDLAIAAAILRNTNQAPLISDDALVMGELQLNGDIRAVPGVLSAVIKAYKQGIHKFYIPYGNLKEIESFHKGQCVGLKHLSQLSSTKVDSICCEEIPKSKSSINYPDFSEIQGHEILKRALTIAAAGKHHVLIFGPPGCGKTFSSRAIQGILPKLKESQALDVTRLWSQAGKWEKGIIKDPPFREPHHSASAEGILGGTSDISPGEISLAHHGVLFLDEAPEFSRRVLQGLREPLETGSIRIVRAGKSFWFPADFQLLMTANPCPCGNLGRKKSPCVCTARDIDQYWKSLSGPLLDRVDIRIPLEPVDSKDLFGAPGIESSRLLKDIEQVQARQIDRNKDQSQPWNSALGPSGIRKYCQMEDTAIKVLQQGMDKLGLSSRAVHSVMKVARTIADLEASEKLNSSHILEAMSYRRYGEGDLFWRKRN